MRVVDKLIEHPDFTGAVSLIRHAAFVAGAESVRAALVTAGQPCLVNTPPASPVTSVNEALLAFASMDHASLLGLGELDIQRVRDICAFSGSDGTPEDVVDGNDVIDHGKSIVGGGEGVVNESDGGGGFGDRLYANVCLVDECNDVVSEPGHVDDIVENAGGVEDVVVRGGGGTNAEGNGDDGDGMM